MSTGLLSSNLLLGKTFGHSGEHCYPSSFIKTHRACCGGR